MTRIATRVGLVALATVVGFVLISPVLVILPMSFSDSAYLSFPPERFSTRWYQSLVDDPKWRTTALNSLRIGLFSTAVAVTLGTLGALGLVRGRMPFKGLITSLVLAPILIPYVVTGLAVYAVALELNLTETTLGFVLIHAALAIPYVVINVTAALASYDVQLDRAAQSLGAGAWTTFRLVTLPNIAPGVYTGGLLAFVISWDEVIVGIFLSGPFMTTLPVEMWSGIRVQIDPTVGALSSVLLLATAAVFIAAATGRHLAGFRRSVLRRRRGRLARAHVRVQTDRVVS